MKKMCGLVCAVALTLALPLSGLAGEAAPEKEAPAVYPVAILPFQERGVGVKGYAEKATDILFAALSPDPALCLVDRADLKHVLDEHELNLTGMVAPGQATQVGQLTGAKILVTGSVIEADKSVYVVAKIIGTETSRVLGASVKGAAREDFAPLVEQLARKVAGTIKESAGQLVAKEVKREDQLKALKDQLAKAKLPIVFVRIVERHVGHATIDPAGQTEMILCCRESGFDVLDPDTAAAGKADVTITGEGFSEFATRRGNLVSVKARIEVKVSDRDTDKILVADRQVALAVDLSEQVAGKSALQKAAFEVALRMLPRLVEEWSKLHPAKK